MGRECCDLLVVDAEGDDFLFHESIYSRSFFMRILLRTLFFASARWASIIGYNPKRAMLTGHQPAHFRFFVKGRLKMIAGCCKGLGRSEMRN